MTFLEKISQFYWRLGKRGDLLTSSILRFLVKHVLSWHPDTEKREDGKKKMIIFTSFLTMTIPLWWHNVCWLSSSLYSRVCLLSVTPSFCFRQELVRCSNFPCILFWDSACLGFIASVRCVEWANCYFWVIIAAMFVCLDRDDLCLASGVRHCSGFLLPSVPAPHPQYYSFQRREDLWQIPSLAPLLCP